MRNRGTVWALVALVVAALAGGGVWWRHHQQEAEADRSARTALTSLATAWGKHDVKGVPFQDSGAANDFTAALVGLGTSPVAVDLKTFSRSGDNATGTLGVKWTLGGDLPWAYDVPVSATRTATGWAIAKPASNSYWHPGLKVGETVAARRTFAPRADLLDRDGTSLMPIGTVYPVQLDPARATAAVASSLEVITDEPAGSLVKKLADAQKANSRAPIPVITYRRSDFDARRDALDALKGVIYPKREQPLAKTRTFMQPLLGSFGPVTADVVKNSKGRYAAGDYAGLSGLQGQYDPQLAGTPGLTVTTSTGKTLFEKAFTPGTEVKTTLDPAVQDAAEAAVAKTGAVPSALVAIDVPTGDVLAVANSPATGFNRALTGHYPPGSTFKVATTYAYLTQGVTTPTTPVTCPKTTVVDGRVFKNFEGEQLGSPTFADDFAHSCNTAFIPLASKLGNSDLATAAHALGIGAGWGKTVGVAGTFDGSVPANNGKTDKAAASIGQGRNEVSPAALAVMTASVARGSYIAPAIVIGDSAGERTPKRLDAKVVGELRDLMGQVVSRGTGTVLKGTPGGPVFGKSGTAEHGSGNPPQTHAWFVAYQGDIAFAVLVEEGRSGGTVAAPIAKQFLTSLAAGH